MRADVAIKIGFTSKLSLWTRLKTLQSANHIELVLLGYLHGTDSDELALHRRFQELHIRGEWFRAEGELLDFVKTVRRDE